MRALEEEEAAGRRNILFYEAVIFLSQVVRPLSRPHGVAGGGPREVKGLLAPSRAMFGLPADRHDHKSYDRQGTTHSRHFAFRTM